MTQTNNSTKQPFNQALLIKQMAMGAGVALLLIAIFLFQVREPDPEWGKFWMVRPLVMVPVAGAIGGLLYYLMNNIFYRSGPGKVLAIMAGVIVYIIVLWLGTILGLDGTLWD